MVITESLARGLRADFWQLLDDEGQRLMRRINTVVTKELGGKPASTTKAVNRHIKLLDTAIAASPLALHSGVCGSKQNSKWWLIYPQVDRSRALNDWRESSLRFDTYRINISPFSTQETWYTVLLGEHCVARMYQRMPWSDTPAARAILPELKELAAWLPWFISMDNMAVKLHAGHVFYAFMPTLNGVFLGSHHPADFDIIELRTFVAKHQLSPRQLALWSAIMDIRRATPAFQTYLGAMVTGSTVEKLIAGEHCLTAMTQLLNIHGEFKDVLLEELVEQHPSLIRPASMSTYVPKRDVSKLDGYILVDED